MLIFETVATSSMQHDMTLTRRIFCEGGPGSILDTVQHAEIFPDSKTFVDMKLNFDPGVVLQSWQTLCRWVDI